MKDSIVVQHCFYEDSEAVARQAGPPRRLVDWTSRLVRQGKASVGAEVASIFERLGFDANRWQATMSSLFGEKKLVGCFFGRQESLAEAARQLDRRWVKQRGTRAVVAG